MVSLRRLTLCGYVLLLAPRVTEGLFFKFFICLLFPRRNICKDPTKAPIVSPVAPTGPIAPSPVAPSPVAPSPIAPSPIAPSPVAPPLPPAPIAPPTPSAPVAPPLPPAPIAPPSPPAFNIFLENGLDKKVHANVQDLGGDFTACVILENRRFRLASDAHTGILGTAAAFLKTLESNKLCFATRNRNMMDGPNAIKLSLEDTDGVKFTFEDTIWFSRLQAAPTVVDILGFNRVPGALLFVTLADDPEVQEGIASTNVNGTGLRPYMPRERVFFVSSFRSSGSLATTNAFLRSSSSSNATMTPIMRLEAPLPPSAIFDNNDFSKGLDGWNSTPATAVLKLASHQEDLAPVRRQVLRRDLQFNNDGYICTDNTDTLQTVRLKRAISVADRIAAGAKKAEVRFRFATNDIDNRNGYHVWLLAQDANSNGYEYFIVGSRYGLVNSGGDPFNLKDEFLFGPSSGRSSKWMTSTIDLLPNVVTLQLIVTVHADADPINQPTLKSCVTVDYLRVF